MPFDRMVGLALYLAAHSFSDRAMTVWGAAS
jgi:hypothetical protein